jgi:cytidylate kinase
MSVITISRGSFSGGKLLAECLAKRLGYRCIDRDVIVEKAAASGVSQKELHEAMLRPPTFLERFTHRKYLYLTLMQAALSEEVRTGRAVYHGNAGHLLLESGGPVLRTRIIAPRKFRIGMARKRLRLTESEAIDYISKTDQGRKKWAHYLYGVDWSDPALYDIVINLEYITIPEACETIATLVKAQSCFDFGPECQEVMDDLATASRVKAELALADPTSHLEFEVHSKQGAIRIRGKLSTPDLLPEVERIVRTVPAVKDVNLDEVAPMPQV